MAKEKKPAREQNLVSAQSENTRGRVFEGIVTKKFPKRIVIEIERTVKIHKYERFYKKMTRIHARVPDALESQVNVGDLIRMQECRPLSKIIHFIVTEKIKSAEEKK